MPDKSNNPFQFWQELKRRNVVRRNTVYAATAFVILEVVSIVEDPLKLPEWILLVVIVLLSIGFIVSIILSWIYDITPEGIEKTKPVHEISKEDKPITSKGWKIASYISFIAIVCLILLNIIPRINRYEENVILEKSIAVLPFENMSDEERYVHIGDAFTDEIIMELQKIKAFDRVLSRTSTMQYSENRPTIPEIAEKLNVNYIIEGSIQRLGDDVRVRVQFIRAINEDHVWADSYNEEINEIEDILRIQSQIAMSIAEELQAVITPEEKQLIDKVPTTSLAAYEFYQRAIAEHEKHWLKWNNMEAVERAEDLYLLALEYDSTFAQAYVGLAEVYWHKHYKDILSENYLDSMLILANKALSFDGQLAIAYKARGDYYWMNNAKEQAIKEYNEAIKLNPNLWAVYLNSSFLYDDEVKIIENLLKAASLHKGFYLSRFYRLIGIHLVAYNKETSYYYLEKALKLDDDSAAHFGSLANFEQYLGNYKKVVEFGEKSLAIDSTDLSLHYIVGIGHSYLGHFEEYLEYFKKYRQRIETLDGISPWGTFRIGHAYWVNGFKEEAEYYFNTGLKFHNERIELDYFSLDIDNSFYNLATLYAFRGDKDEAYKNLRFLNQRQRIPLWMINDIKNDPLFDSIRDEPEFQQIVKEVEAKYQAEHERVMKWLEENDML
jgi:TolB-like protein